MSNENKENIQGLLHRAKISKRKQNSENKTYSYKEVSKNFNIEPLREM